ncbi:universal stress protein [Azospirillum soli]|uniref:universal stress protein n=1 Tax=Azospirillum soli TaxID=1304799 RepID=UPI001AE9D227|nr:universal stress protein [Azospirillum soli]MBP2316184.1 nucleotide-binding universal stress UspA family protein [Azospirillum soli]
MIKHILTLASGSASDANLLADAFDLAQPFSAHVDVLHIRRDPRRGLPVHGEGMSLEAIESIAAEAERKAVETAATARRTFEQAAADASAAISDRRADGMTARWRELVGEGPYLLAAEARFADLTVLARPAGAPEPLGVLEGALFESGRPVLLAGGGMTRLDSVAIAWNGSPSAVRAVAGAWDFIARASTVSILVVEQGVVNSLTSAITGRIPSDPERLAEHLAWHGVQSSIRKVGREGRSVGEALALAAREQGAGLLVMGGYGHSRLREIVLGGATRYVLSHAVGCPVLLAH